MSLTNKLHACDPAQLCFLYCFNDDDTLLLIITDCYVSDFKIRYVMTPKCVIFAPPEWLSKPFFNCHKQDICTLSYHQQHHSNNFLSNLFCTFKNRLNKFHYYSFFSKFSKSTKNVSLHKLLHMQMQTVKAFCVRTNYDILSITTGQTHKVFVLIFQSQYYFNIYLNCFMIKLYMA